MNDMSKISRAGAGTAARAVTAAANTASGVLGRWVLLYLLDANPENNLVTFLRDASRWLAGWSYDLFAMDTDWLRVVLNYGIPAVVYLVAGHTLASRIRRGTDS
jgi:hypothetical protein